jgi:arylsulfate sulfotransferase
MKKLFFLLLLSALLHACGSDQGPKVLDEITLGEVKVQVNPSGKVPLGALLTFSTQENCTAKVTVTGKEPVSRTFSKATRYHDIPVLGLYPGTANQVAVEVTDESGQRYVDTLTVEAPAIPDFFPTIDITKIDRSRMEPGLHLFDMLFANNGKFLTYTILFDDSGTIRWYMDMSDQGQITYTNYRLKNGNWLYLNWIDLIEVDDLGRVVREEKLFNNAGDHELLELPDGSIMMGGSMKDAYVVADGMKHPSRFDAVFIWDRKQGRPVKEWDLRQVLDVDRLVFPPDYSPDYRSDWFHINSFYYDQSEKSLIISGRNQGVLKVDDSNNLQWILAPHKDWGKAGPEGKGLNTADYLLTAVDSDGNPLPEAVQKGTAGTDNFEWPTGQHAVRILENGNLLLFDNGLMRNFKPGATYSRAVEYKIDDEKQTIQQVWEYGKERGLELFSAITSDVDVLPDTGNRLVTAGNVRASAKPPHATMVEITYPDNEVIFEADIFFKDARGTGERSWAQFDLVFRGERFDLVPE